MEPVRIGLLVAVMAASGCHFPRRAPSKLTCVQEVCATLIRYVEPGVQLEVTAPEGAVLHQALRVRAGAPPCQAGTGMVALRTETLFYTHGPAPIGSTHQLTLYFGAGGGEAVDLDVRTTTGAVCVRVPLLEAGTEAPDAG